MVDITIRQGVIGKKEIMKNWIDKDEIVVSLSEYRRDESEHDLLRAGMMMRELDPRSFDDFVEEITDAGFGRELQEALIRADNMICLGF